MMPTTTFVPANCAELSFLNNGVKISAWFTQRQERRKPLSPLVVKGFVE